MNILAVISFLSCVMLAAAQGGAPLVPANNQSQPVQNQTVNVASRIWSMMQGRKINYTATTTTTTAATTTTGEGAELEEEGGRSTQRPFNPPTRYNRGFNYYDFFNQAPPTTNSYYDYGYNQYHGNGMSGGGVGEDSEEEMPNTTPQHYQRRRFNRFNRQRPNIIRMWANQRRRNLARTWALMNRMRNALRSAVAATTAPPTTTMATTPEPDDENPTGHSSGQTGNAAKDSYSGFCFCSPLNKCPMGSVNRGGSCQNFITYFLRLRFLRCCYRPSFARKFQL